MNPVHKRGCECCEVTDELVSEVERLRAALERASAELRHSYKYRPIDPNLVARAIELLERAALSPLERDALSPPAKESGSSESSTVPVQAVKPTQDGSEASVSGSSEGAPAKDGRGTLPQKGDHGGELDSKLKSRLVITDARRQSLRDASPEAMRETVNEYLAKKAPAKAEEPKRCDHLLLPANGTCVRCGMGTEP